MPRGNYDAWSEMILPYLQRVGSGHYIDQGLSRFEDAAKQAYTGQQGPALEGLFGDMMPGGLLTTKAVKAFTPARTAAPMAKQLLDTNPGLSPETTRYLQNVVSPPKKTYGQPMAPEKRQQIQALYQRFKAGDPSVENEITNLFGGMGTFQSMYAASLL